MHSVTHLDPESLPDDHPAPDWPSVVALDNVLNSRVARATTDAEQHVAMQLKAAVKRQLSRLPDEAIEAAAKDLLRDVGALCVELFGPEIAEQHVAALQQGGSR